MLSEIYIFSNKALSAGLTLCAAELFVSSFHSVEAGIANVISSFK